MSTKLNSATVQHILQANKVWKKVKQSRGSLKYGSMHKPLKLVAHCDASYTNLKDGSSQGGMIIFLVDSKGRASPISWTSKKLRRVSTSTIAAETMSLLDTIDACMWLSHYSKWADRWNAKNPRNIHWQHVVDRSSSLVHSTKAVEEKQLRVDIAAVRESIKHKEIIVQWIDNKGQLADVFTKQGANSQVLLDVMKYGQI